MSGLQQNLQRLSATRSAAQERRARTRSQLAEFLDMRIKKVEPPTPVGGTPVAAGAVERRMGGASGPHSQGDGHNHSDSGQSVGEANELWNRLQKMLKDAPHKITPGKRTRDYATQVKLWNDYKAGKGPMAAKPGTSKHGSGRANDLQYSNDAARAWALANAEKYGLHFPIYNPKLGRGRDESWHIELKK